MIRGLHNWLHLRRSLCCVMYEQWSSSKASFLRGGAIYTTVTTTINNDNDNTNTNKYVKETVVQGLVCAYVIPPTYCLEGAPGRKTSQILSARKKRERQKEKNDPLQLQVVPASHIKEEHLETQVCQETNLQIVAFFVPGIHAMSLAFDERFFHQRRSLKFLLWQPMRKIRPQTKKKIDP